MAALKRKDAITQYAGTVVGQLHQYLASAGSVTAGAPGDPAKVAAAIIGSAAVEPAPRRLVLGSDSHEAIRTALTARLSEIDAGKNAAAAIDF